MIRRDRAPQFARSAFSRHRCGIGLALIAGAAAVWLSVVIVADVGRRVAERAEHSPAVGDAVCDTDENCARWCEMQGLSCDGSPSPGTRLLKE